MRITILFGAVVALAGCANSASDDAAEQLAVRASALTTLPTVSTWDFGKVVSPTPLNYTVAANFDADFCELYVNGFGKGSATHNVFSSNWLEAYVSVPAQQGALENVGMFTRSKSPSGTIEVFITLGTQIEPNYWRTGFNSYLHNGDGLIDDHFVIDFAFFVDVKRPDGGVVRLWQSNHGVNYTVDEVFALPFSGRRDLGLGDVSFANNDADIFLQKKACQH